MESRPTRSTRESPAHGATPGSPRWDRPPDEAPEQATLEGLAAAADAAVDEARDRDGAVALYVHLPFCVRKCRYCDFNSWALTDQDLERHVDAVLREAAARAEDLAPSTVFFGGGTPSLLPPALLTRLLDGLDACTGFRASAHEVTLEANPESFDAATAAAARAGGIDRISLGVQSLQAEVLTAYDRVHDAGQAREAFRCAREAGFARVNVDLIYAFPGQDPEVWERDLREVIGWEPDHLSAYELSYEPGTALTRLRDAGRWPTEPEERRLILFEETRALLAAHGFGQYEVSNFARPGEACRHNLAYWRSQDWVGIGAGASGSRGGERRKNLERPEDYEAAVLAGQDPVGESERPDAPTLLFDVFLMGLRLTREGVSLARAKELSGLDPAEHFGATWRELLEEGLLDSEGDRVRVTHRGLLLLDSVLERLLPTLRV